MHSKFLRSLTSSLVEQSNLIPPRSSSKFAGSFGVEWLGWFRCSFCTPHPHRRSWNHAAKHRTTLSDNGLNSFSKQCVQSVRRKPFRCLIDDHSRNEALTKLLKNETHRWRQRKKDHDELQLLAMAKQPADVFSPLDVDIVHGISMTVQQPFAPSKVERTERTCGFCQERWSASKITGSQLPNLDEYLVCYH